MNGSLEILQQGGKRGLLARSIPKSSILGANSKVRELLKESNLSTSSTTVTKTRGFYAKFTQKQKAVFAAENGVTAAVRNYIKNFQL